MKSRNPHSPEVVQEVIDEIRKMTPEEALATLFYRDPDVEETDMLGILEERDEAAGGSYETQKPQTD